MEGITPREFDPNRISPDEDAEPIVALSFLLELPHCLRIDDVAFLVSDRGGTWPGWNPDAIGYATGMSMPAPEDDLKPRFRVEVKQTRVNGWVPLRAAEQAFPDWQMVERPRRPSGATVRGANELRSVVQITIYDLASKTPLAQGQTDAEHFEHEIAEWMSRRLDEALSFLNQYLVILGGMRDEWHISSLSRIDLPRDTPWKLNLFPTPEGWICPSGTVDVHSTLRDDLPALKAPFRNQLTELLPKFLDEALDLEDESLPPGRWYNDCYLLRNRVVHEGQKATAGEAYDSKVATGDFVRWIGKSLSPDPHTEWIRAVSQFQRQP